MENINSRLELAEESENQKKGYLKLSKQRKRKVKNTVLKPAFKREVLGICPGSKKDILFVETPQGLVLLI